MLSIRQDINKCQFDKSLFCSVEGLIAQLSKWEANALPSRLPSPIKITNNFDIQLTKEKSLLNLQN